MKSHNVLLWQKFNRVFIFHNNRISIISSSLNGVWKCQQPKHVSISLHCFSFVLIWWSSANIGYDREKFKTFLSSSCPGDLVFFLTRDVILIFSHPESGKCRHRQLQKCNKMGPYCSPGHKKGEQIWLLVFHKIPLSNWLETRVGYLTKSLHWN